MKKTGKTKPFLNYVTIDCLLDFPGGIVVKNLPASAGDIRDSGSIPGSGRFSTEGNGNPLQYSCLGNPMDRGAWQTTVQVTESDTTENARTIDTFYFWRSGKL